MKTEEPVIFPTIVVLNPKVKSNVVSIVRFFVLIPNLATDLPYVAYIQRGQTLRSISRKNRLLRANLMPDSESVQKTGLKRLHCSQLLDLKLRLLEMLQVLS